MANTGLTLLTGAPAKNQILDTSEISPTIWSILKILISDSHGAGILNRLLLHSTPPAFSLLHCNDSHSIFQPRQLSWSLCHPQNTIKNRIPKKTITWPCIVRREGAMLAIWRSGCEALGSLSCDRKPGFCVIGQRSVKVGTMLTMRNVWLGAAGSLMLKARHTSACWPEVKAQSWG